MIYQIQSRLPGESFEDYLRRNNAHPDQPDRRGATPEEMAAFDVTSQRVGTGLIIMGPLGTPRPCGAQVTKKRSNGGVMTKESAPRKSRPGSHLAVAWAPFAQELATSLAKLGEDQFLILSVKRSNRFVQFAAQGSSGMRTETTSNSYLDRAEQLDQQQISALIDAGWNDPTGTSAGSTSAGDPDGSPNYFVEFLAPVSFESVANLTARTFAEILRVAHPGSLEYEAFDEEGGAIELSEMGLVKRAPPTDSERD